MRLNKQYFLGFFRRWFFYELILVVSSSVAGFVFLFFHINNWLSRDLLVNFLLVTMSLVFISWFAAKLRGQVAITLNLSFYICIAFLLAELVNFQAVVTIGVILATTFLYECYPFYLRRWVGFWAVKYAIDATAIFLLGLFLIWKNVTAFSFVWFFVLYFILIFIRRVILPAFDRVFEILRDQFLS